MQSSSVRTAIVTGAAGALGAATAQALAQQGQRVLMLDIEEAALREASLRLPNDQVATLAADITARNIGHMIDEVIAGRGWQPATILVNNAAISPRPNGLSPAVLEMKSEFWNRLLEVNVTAPMFLCQHVIPSMQQAKWGRIVNVASGAGRFRPVNSGPAYVTSKAALLGLTRSIASTYGVDGITCNSVAPGLVISGLSGQLTPERMQKVVSGTALGRVGEAHELGATIAFLASDGAGYITGACIDVNGGIGMM